MGLFDSFRSATAPTFNVQQALMTIVIAAVKADGEVTREEVGRIRAMCALSPIFATNSTEQDDALIGFADNVTTQLGEQALTKAAEVLKPELRETAFAFACDIVLADGIVGRDEEAFLTSLMGRLGVSEDVGRFLVGATLIRNRGL